MSGSSERYFVDFEKQCSGTKTLRSEEKVNYCSETHLKFAQSFHFWGDYFDYSGLFLWVGWIYFIQPTKKTNLI